MVVFLLIGTILPLLLFAHGTEDHSKSKLNEADSMIQMQQEIRTSNEADDMEKLQMESINREYQARVKKIFNFKCVDCHGTPDRYQ